MDELENTLKPLTDLEELELFRSERRSLAVRMRFGRAKWPCGDSYWMYDPAGYSLVHAANQYRVPLMKCNALEEILFWMGHLNEKSGGNADVIGAFFQAIEDIFAGRCRSWREPVNVMTILDGIMSGKDPYLDG